MQLCPIHRQRHFWTLATLPVFVLWQKLPCRWIPWPGRTSLPISTRMKRTPNQQPPVTLLTLPLFVYNVAFFVRQSRRARRGGRRGVGTTATSSSATWTSRCGCAGAAAAAGRRTSTTPSPTSSTSSSPRTTRPSPPTPTWSSTKVRMFPLPCQTERTQKKDGECQRHVFIRVWLCTFAVIGCPLPEPPDGASVEVTGDMAAIKCNNSQVTFHLVCSGTEWSGPWRNCTEGELSKWGFVTGVDGVDSLPTSVPTDAEG